MKIFTLIGVTSVLWLAGCASTGVSTTAGPDAANPQAGASTTPPQRPATAQLPHQSIFPDGALQPITAAQIDSSGVAQLVPPAELWERIRRGFAMPNLDNPLVRDREQWYSTRPDYMLRMTERSSKYLFHIVEELEMRNMPSELALLPFIESAFNPQAVSSAKAAGMWQFMPATGKHFELRQNAFRDDRRDVLASTRAALDYLQKLHGMFGDWHLALAAYNWGEGSVARAIAKNKRAGLGTAYTDLQMPAETRLYVPKLQAVKNIVADPQVFNTRLPDIGNHPFFQSVEIQRDIDVALAAKLADVSLADFKALNPSARHPVILAAGTPQILLPWDNAGVFRHNLQAYGDKGLASWTVWRAPRTMKPADAAERVGMSESELRSVNNIPPRMLIKAGSSLLVPRSNHIMADVTGQVADNGQLSLAPETLLKRRVIKARKQDTVARLARRYQLNPDSVAEWNKVSATATFKLGQRVVLYLPQATPRAKIKGKAQSGTRQARRTASKTRRLAKQ